MAYLINLPYTKADTQSPKYSLQVSKSGYTTGYTTYLKDVSVPLMSIRSSYQQIAPLVQTKYWAVTTYWTGNIDLDDHLYLPAGAPDQGYIGSNSGLLGDRPYVRMFMNGGVDGNPPTDAVIIRPKTGTSYPWYYSYGNYTILIRQHSGTSSEFNDSVPVVRVWYGGLVKKIIFKTDPCTAGEAVWWAGTIRTTVVAIDDCNATITPYSVDESTYSIAGAGE
jgi:hypothetical protein